VSLLRFADVEGCPKLLTYWALRESVGVPAARLPSIAAIVMPSHLSTSAMDCRMRRCYVGFHTRTIPNVDVVFQVSDAIILVELAFLYIGMDLALVMTEPAIFGAP
jgi:hypothetical protein